MKIKTRFACSIVCIFCLTVTAVLRAESGDDNPTGPAGMFNGEITTGCAYSPYTRNATRRVTDILIPSGVGARPLAFTRIANSRMGGGYKPFAYAGSWEHSYDWVMSDEPYNFSNPNTLPTTYNVDFPDGRFIPFTSAEGTPADAAGETNFRGPIGLSERVTPLRTANGAAILILSDGTKITFQATVHNLGGGAYFRTYQALQITDRFGLVTTLSYNADGTVNRITEPGGRWLQLSYQDFINGSVIDHVLSSVEASDGRFVRYSYQSGSFSSGAPSYTYLATVSYYDDPAIPVASYVYKAPNVPDFTGGYNGPPSLAYCNDPMYEGPMKQIAYDYLHYNVDPSAEYGELLSEKHQIAANPVSTISSGGNGIDITRTETRGDGPSRTITYRTWPHVGHILVSYTSFIPIDPPDALGYGSSNYLTYFEDADGNSTSMLREPITGRMTSLTHPPDANNVQSSVSYVYSATLDPYYLDHVTDELSHTTYYRRDSLHRINRIDYPPDSGYETFTYNSFNQILSHRLTSGGTETFAYDARGLKTAYRDPYHQTGHPNFWYLYDGLDRLWKVTDSRGGYAGDPAHTTVYNYNSRGQTTKVTHPDGSYVQYGYDGAGNRTSVTDELGHVTSSTYDDYRRLSTVTTPQRAPGDLTPRTTYTYYDRAGGAIDDYRHTDANVTLSKLPSGKMQKIIYDNNFRKTSVVAAPSTSEQSTTSYGYDPVGNMLSVTDPRNRVTSYGYDARNRLLWMNDPISTDRNSLGHTVSYAYDQANNKLSEQRANNQVITYNSYDPMNRLTQKTVAQTPNPAAITHWAWYQSGMLHTMTDPRGKIYTYGYDLMNRKTSLAYPADSAGVARSEGWHYDVAGNLDTFTNRAGKVQTFTYDNRNRETGFSWNDGATSSHSTSYDYASRVLDRHSGTDALDYVYDNANNLTSETQTSGGPIGPRPVSYTYDADSNRKTIAYPSGSVYTYDYSQRNQMTSIKGAAPTPLATYTYDLSGNVIRRSLGNGAVTDYAPADPLNRITWIKHTFAGANVARFDYAFDTVSRRKYEQRDSAQGDAWSYDLNDQLTISTRDTSNPTGTPGDGLRTTWGLDAAGNRTEVESVQLPLGRPVLVGDYTTNNLNQYTSGGPAGSFSYDVNGNLASTKGAPDNWAYTYDAENRLIGADNNDINQHLNFYYDALNRQILRYVNGAWIYSVWDGWNLIEEWDVSGTLLHAYVHGAGCDEMVERSGGGAAVWYSQDGRGNTSHLSDAGGNLVEKYRYDMYGAPHFYNAAGTPLSASAYDNRFLFTGRDYSKELGLYDYRNRFYHPGLARFLQPDPVGFKGDASNLYRYCGNSVTNHSDWSGLGDNNPNDGIFYSQGSNAYWNAQAATQYAAGQLNSSEINFYEAVRPVINAGISFLDTSDGRATVGVGELIEAGHLDLMALVFVEVPPFATLFAGVGAWSLHDGIDDLTAASQGEGMHVEPVPPYEPPPIPTQYLPDDPPSNIDFVTVTPDGYGGGGGGGGGGGWMGGYGVNAGASALGSDWQHEDLSGGTDSYGIRKWTALDKPY